MKLKNSEIHSKKTVDKKHNIFRNIEKWLVSLVGRFIIRKFMILAINGKNNIPREGGYIIASSHKKMLDPVIIGTVITSETKRQDYHFVAKIELWAKRFTKWFCNLFDAIPVDRNNPDRGIALKLVRVVNNGQIVALFPSATRLDDESFDKLSVEENDDIKKGFSAVAELTKAPVLPVDITYYKKYKAIVSFGKLMYLNAEKNLSKEEKNIVRNEFTSNVVEEIRKLRPEITQIKKKKH